MIAPDVGATGRPDLDKSKFFFVPGIAINKPFDRQKALENPFRVVDAVYAHAHIERLHAQFFEQGLPFPAGRSRARQWRVLLGRGHANRKWPHHGQMSFAIYGKSLPFNPGLKGAVYSLQKVVAVGLNVKPNQIGPQQSIQ